ncbi:hydrogenase nickel incorporation protein HypB [Natrarchaeobaculum sulfurireducens]|uniref:Hydrogenase maturation factor HypB n=1 Tax=Natrarchaeobaculum sulfurireducens TaxID=2044521 RepID=A0A346PKF7_9EURY|nr:hydrogenase nickel incorporation protein HypB [Natrarchaeobaculum sulfurireducens]AXR80002.1 Hydrogenase maturation factor HypB [Natrarchaeobaculum sulfurireducens]
MTPYTNATSVRPSNQTLESLAALSDPFESLIDTVRAHRFGHEHHHDHEESITDVEADVLEAVRARAGEVHETLSHDNDVFCIEFAGSTGGGKTMLIERLIERASDDETIGAVVGDVAGKDDATRLRSHGVQVENINTGKECHLDPTLVSQALEQFVLEELDTLYLENVGNMVCPADFPLGANRRVLVVSTTEGDDVVRKHPMLVQTADVVVINKIDVAEVVGTDVARIRKDIENVAPETPVFETDAKGNVGIDEFASALEADHGHYHGHRDESTH